MHFVDPTFFPKLIETMIPDMQHAKTPQRNMKHNHQNVRIF
jgi:hypothetical protein